MRCFFIIQILTFSSLSLRARHLLVIEVQSSFPLLDTPRHLLPTSVSALLAQYLWHLLFQTYVLGLLLLHPGWSRCRTHWMKVGVNKFGCCWLKGLLLSKVLIGRSSWGWVMVARMLSWNWYRRTSTELGIKLRWRSPHLRSVSYHLKLLWCSSWMRLNIWIKCSSIDIFFLRSSYT